ncbi:flagellar filament capping protein FliD [Romboutsia lituseburensis]|uniref:flagellar filament capping protein FliD n=1 Tax=Romboutsia lituseburensis TaxID=1537 RepID=UPI00215AEBC2|nr:flagellar filament capping protein FliD [Romboutsia lituseburensis]MCR8746693.1 flagellar filament capping protein FliD [Romboutsia lituseburensis]
MSSVSGIRLPGLSTGMDTEKMVKEMLKGEQNKIDKVKQKEQTIKWQQEIYREVIKDTKGFNDKYFSLSSKNSILNSGAWNTLSVSSSNSNVITATGTAGANKVDYDFEVKKLAEPAKASSTVEIKSANTKLGSIAGFKGDTFKLEIGTDKDGKPIYSQKITVTDDDTIQSLSKKINDATEGEIKASYSEMTNKFTIETKDTGSISGFKIVKEDGSDSDALEFLKLEGKNKDGNITNNNFVGEQSEIIVKNQSGKELKKLNEDSNSFNIDGIKYEVNSVGEAKITSKQDTQPVVENMKAFVEDYNKLMDKMYDLVTQKINRDYPPLTEAQKEDMSEEEIERWEKKAKDGLLRNDSEMRKFMDDMQKSIFGDNMKVLNEMGISSHEDYNKRGQLSLDEKKLTKALENNGEEVYEIFAGNNNSVMENMKSTINKYVGGSSAIFAKKAGLEKTSSAAHNFYSEQLKRQADTIKMLQRKMSDKENSLYKKFGALESSMNKLNSQMSYFMQM